MKYLTRKDFAPHAGCRTRDIDLAGMGRIRLRQLTAPESLEMQRLAKEIPEDDLAANMDFNARFVAATMIDPETGQRLFDAGSESVLLAALSREALNELFRQCMELQGMTQAAMDRAEKNSGQTPSDDGGSASPGSADVPTRISCSQV